MLKVGVYHLGTAVLSLILQILFRLEVRGRDNIPRDGGFLLVARHRSYWDIPILICSLGASKRIHFVARRTLLKNPFFYPFVKAYAIPIDRDRFGREDLRKVLRAVAGDRIVGIFPEGTTRPTEQIRTGAIRFAERSGMPLLPVRLEVDGPYPPDYPWGFPRIRAWIGRPFTLRELESRLEQGLTRRERYRRLGSLLMRRIDRAGRCEKTEQTGIASESTRCYDVEDVP